jgi:hypothetical protein
VNLGRVREIAPLKLCRLLLEVGLNEGDLLAVGGVFGGDGLQPAVVLRLEEMPGLFEIEGHHLRPAGGHLGLTGRG